MADAGGNQIVNSKITCVSRKCIVEITRAVNDEIEKIITKNVDWTDEQKERFRQRFTEIYSSAFYENILVDGQSSSETGTDNDVTTGLELINHERRQYVNSTLLPALDHAIKRTTRNRKHCPLVCTQYLRRQGKAESHFLSGATVKVESSLTLEPTAKGSFEEIQSRLQGSCKELKTLMKTLPETVDQFERLQKAIQMNKAMTSKTDDVIFNPLPEEDKMADSMTPLRKRINHTEVPASPKKIKLDSVLNRGKANRTHRGYKLK